jgi:hypothetical protein
VILDGTLIPIDRVADQKPYYSGKHRRHGVNVQVFADPAGRLIRASAALPGAIHDLTAARTGRRRSCRPSLFCTMSRTRPTQDEKAHRALTTVPSGR